MAGEQAPDPVITHLRREILDNDRAIVQLVNKRLGLVTTIRDYKARQGMPFLDADREQWMLTYLQRTNSGLLSAGGLAELFGEILALTKREVLRFDAGEP